MCVRSRLYYTRRMSEPFDLEALDDTEPFEVDKQAAHLFKHPHLGMDDVIDAWSSDPLPIGRSEQVPTDRLLRGVFGPRRYVPEGP